MELFKNAGDQLEGRDAVEVHSAEVIGLVFDILQGEQKVVAEPVHHLVVIYHRQTFKEVGG